MRVLRALTYWLFQAVNLPVALAMVLVPGSFHETLFKNPVNVYASLGFSPLAVEMLHTVLRGQGAALLAVSLFLLLRGGRQREAYLLIFLTTLCALGAHLATLHQHLDSPEVVLAIGDFSGLYAAVATAGVLCVASALVWVFWRDDRRSRL